MAARTDGARARRRVVDQMGALQMQAVGPEVSDFQCGFLPRLFSTEALHCWIYCDGGRAQPRRSSPSSRPALAGAKSNRSDSAGRG